MKNLLPATTATWVGGIALTGVLLIGIALAVPAPVRTSAVVGDWNGALSTAIASLRVVIHVAQDEDGRFTATMDVRCRLRRHDE